MLHAIILAGGLGTRLWPASRTTQPKPLLVFEKQQTLLQATIQRLTGLVPTDRIWLITSRPQADQITSSLDLADVGKILVEPFARNTAPSIGWAALKLRQVDPDAIMIVLPADHIIKPAPVFRKTIKSAANIVKQSPETLVTIGVKPTFPATSYGYIRRGDVLPTSKYPAYHVRQFCEKPNQETAEKFFQSEEYYWNAGIFVWKAETILKLLHQFEPKLSILFGNIEQSFGTKRENCDTKMAFQCMESISVDYAVMERAKKIVVLESKFKWNDVGTWTALDRLYADKKDKRGNLAVSSSILAIDSMGCTVRCDCPDHLVALVGMQDIIVIQTADATLIARKDQEESVRRVAEELKKRKNESWN